MFNKLKQFQNLRTQAKKLQDTLSQESVTATAGDVQITMNGNLKITNLDIKPDSLSPNNAEKIKKWFMDAHQEALEKMQKIMAYKMKEMGGLPEIPGLK